MSTQSISPASASAQFPYPASAAAAAPSYFPVPFHLQTSQYPTWPTVAPAQPAPAYNAVYPMPQVQQHPFMFDWGLGHMGDLMSNGYADKAPFAELPLASHHNTSTFLPHIGCTAQQLFQRDSQIISPEALATVKAAIADNDKDKKVEANKKAVPRKAAGQCWEDLTLADWPENDFRLFCGDLGNEVNDDVLTKTFSKYPSFNMAKVIRDKSTGKTKGYGFVSFANASDLAAALKEMNDSATEEAQSAAKKCFTQVKQIILLVCHHSIDNDVQCAYSTVDLTNDLHK
uniref:Uncharacterized protein n=1 Tax=Aegilops tauschii TaxID=37682 RepID=R7WDG4_AEGTA